MSEAMEQANWALNAKVEHFVANAEYEPLVAYLEQIASDSSNTQEVTAALLKLGEVRLEMMDDYEAAIEAYQRLLEVDSDNGSALEALEMAYTASEDWVALLAILERKVAVAPDESDALASMEQCAAIYEDMLGDPEAALEFQRDILTMFPKDASAIAAVERLEAQLV